MTKGAIQTPIRPCIHITKEYLFFAISSNSSAWINNHKVLL